MPTACKFAFCLIALFSCGALAYAADAKGWSDSCCEVTNFHFTDFPGRASGEELRLRLQTGFPLLLETMPHAWWGHVEGQRCTRDGKCEEIKADLQVQKVSKKHVSGKYVADFDGQHLAGQFSVKRHHKGPPCHCL